MDLFCAQGFGHKKVRQMSKTAGDGVNEEEEKKDEVKIKKDMMKTKKIKKKKHIHTVDKPF